MHNSDFSRIAAEATKISYVLSNRPTQDISIETISSDDPDAMDKLIYSEYYASSTDSYGNTSLTPDAKAYRGELDYGGHVLIKCLLPMNVDSISFLDDQNNEIAGLDLYETDEYGNRTYVKAHYSPFVLRFEHASGSDSTDFEEKFHEQCEKAHFNQITGVAINILGNSLVSKDFLKKEEGLAYRELSSQMVNGNLITQDFDMFFCGNLMRQGDNVISPQPTEHHPTVDQEFTGTIKVRSLSYSNSFVDLTGEISHE